MKFYDIHSSKEEFVLTNTHYLEGRNDKGHRIIGEISIKNQMVNPLGFVGITSESCTFSCDFEACDFRENSKGCFVDEDKVRQEKFMQKIKKDCQCNHTISTYRE